ncbi:group III truncated hemoglobin [uncultured Maricaulis sp.]|uniref:group III truncated hemoglobin n=1 Tax=uncultured Maricaulis sp. TaxID=174710 RepID=UPI0030DBBB73
MMQVLDTESAAMPAPVSPPVSSARPQMTADLMARTGLDEAMLERLVHGFYDRVRADALLGPVFAERIDDWGPHLERMVEFWSSVALMTGRYHGAPMPKHLPLPVAAEHFVRWLELFRLTAGEVCPPAGADWVIERAERIATSIHMNIETARDRDGRAAPPTPSEPERLS